MNAEKLPVFPLSAHILPGGRMALRIFEPRYLRMVKHACATDTVFVICMHCNHVNIAQNQQILPIGTAVRVIDFNTLPDGLLGIKVAGEYCVEVDNVVTEFDGLQRADCKKYQVWNAQQLTQQIAPMDERLKEIFAQFTDLAQQYDELKFSDSNWVLFRWLELLPIDAKKKQHFLVQKDAKELLSYLFALHEVMVDKVPRVS
ncbi:LON peptidase substrate-binding domain-containing protein [Alteromonas sp. ASW11-130]|uniref:LON peptidase substrate-binding domain-containing protein n=1 Tax=Alteromonas sp. ASW11-130 TaxID=3015775 RepID=UPI002241EDCF|nr:LON peptidase substrate-binding domain-containing protein [Alteromonas sp. ASW11-130]MCW8093023.1 LON peptidase substrate-binding domain-containing protein [Alteromonas sp. ASW11-130]